MFWSPLPFCDRGKYQVQYGHSCNVSEGKADWLQYTWYDVNRKVSISTMLVAVSLRIAAHVMQLV